MRPQFATFNSLNIVSCTFTWMYAFYTFNNQ